MVGYKPERIYVCVVYYFLLFKQILAMTQRYRGHRAPEQALIGSALSSLNAFDPSSIPPTHLSLRPFEINSLGRPSISPLVANASRKIEFLLRTRCLEEVIGQLAPRTP